MLYQGQNVLDLLRTFVQRADNKKSGFTIFYTGTEWKVMYGMPALAITKIGDTYTDTTTKLKGHRDLESALKALLIAQKKPETPAA